MLLAEEMQALWAGSLQIGLQAQVLERKAVAQIGLPQRFAQIGVFLGLILLEEA